MGADIFVVYSADEWIGAPDYGIDKDLLLKHYNGKSWEEEIVVQEEDNLAPLLTSVSPHKAEIIYIAYIDWNFNPTNNTREVYFLKGTGIFTYKPTVAAASFLEIMMIPALVSLVIICKKKRKGN